MKYETKKPFEFSTHGYSNRRDTDAQPRVLMLGIELDEHRIHFHIAGHSNIYSAPVADVVSDEELIAGFEPMDALRIGQEFARQRYMSRTKESQ